MIFLFPNRKRIQEENTIIFKIARYIKVDFPEDIKRELKNGAGKKKKVKKNLRPVTYTSIP